jgi:hypothetical protein
LQSDKKISVGSKIEGDNKGGHRVFDSFARLILLVRLTVCILAAKVYLEYAGMT